MDISALLVDLADRRIAKAAPRFRTTDHAKVTTVTPLTVTFDGDTAAVPMTPVVGLSCSVGDRVGLIKYGTRWYAAHVLKGS